MQVSVRAVTLHRNNLELAAKVPRVEAAKRQTVPVARQNCGRILNVVLSHLEQGAGRCGVQVRPDFGQAAPGDPSSLVAHFDRDVFVPLSDHDLDRRRLEITVHVLVRHRPQGILDQFEDHVVQVIRHVRALQRLVPRKNTDVWRGAVLAQANVPRIFHCLVHYVEGRHDGVYQPDLVRHRGVVKRQMLPNKHSNPDARHVETIQKRVDVWQLIPRFGRGKILFERGDSECHHGHYKVVPLLDLPQQMRELLLVVQILYWPHLSQLLEGLHVPVPHLQHLRLI
mmetsp:Transcript_12916/g.33462  ORF Transcript_12916/g.33462 Transcript_12916/m.33462 type:complete len:283 (-) Transcript_12916:253-1101(-)